ncbi:MAG: 1-deoxy-D-xylulose-5-phosphate reductoisomerase, partial [Clostridia bacterium]|nr:1-deoxy-D-xylulose-5-phosphate reductoisomerase [Clostridia bacterium]
APFDKIDVIIHRESIIHSMVEYNDGSVIAQMSYPSMELPIEIALSYPERKISGLKSLDFAKIGKLTFEKTDNERFPCLNLVISAGKAGGLYPAVVNGANEQAVKLFLEQKIKYNDIYAGLDFALSSFSDNAKPSLDSVTVADAFGRNAVKKLFGE